MNTNHGIMPAFRRLLALAPVGVTRLFCNPYTATARSFSSLLVLACAVSLVAPGCMNSRPKPPALSVAEAAKLRPGDVIKIAFPQVPSLDTTQQIRRDGKINLYLIGEVEAADLSPAGLEEKLLALYEPHVVSREIRVTVVSSAFAVFVTGAVVRPGKLTPERTLTAIEAIMEAGGFDPTKANPKAVTIIRNEDGRTTNYRVNLQAVLDGKAAEPFYLQAYDIVYVPEKVSWF